MVRDWPARGARALDRAVGSAALLIDQSFAVRWASSSWQRIFGYDPVGTPGFDLLHPDDVDFAVSVLLHHHEESRLYAAQLRTSADEIVPPSSEMRVRHADGRWLPCMARIDNRVDDPEVGAVVIHVQRTNEQAALSRAIDLIATAAPAETALLAALTYMSGDRPQLHTGPMAVAWYDDAGLRHVTTHAPTEVASLLFAPEVSALPQRGGNVTITHVANLPPGPARDGAERLGLACLWTVPIGEPYEHLGHVLSWSAYEFATELRPFTRFATGCDVVRLALHERRRREMARRHAITDPLTGVFNRTGLNEAFTRLAIREPTIGALFIDIDDFKQVNDAWGHAVGDQVLAEVARRLDHICRANDVVARMGGDEFVILCASVEPTSITGIIRRVEDCFDEPVLTEAGPVRIKASIGFGAASRGGGLTDLLRDADDALYAMKRRAKADDR